MHFQGCFWANTVFQVQFAHYPLHSIKLNELSQTFLYLHACVFLYILVYFSMHVVMVDYSVYGNDIQRIREFIKCEHST